MAARSNGLVREYLRWGLPVLIVATGVTILLARQWLLPVVFAWGLLAFGGFALFGNYKSRSFIVLSNVTVGMTLGLALLYLAR